MIGEEPMSTTLDKLKTLNSLLDKKIVETREKKGSYERGKKIKSLNLSNKSFDIEVQPVDSEESDEAPLKLKATIPAIAKKRGVATKGRRPKRDIITEPDSAYVGKLVTDLLGHLKIDRAKEPVRSRNIVRLTELYARLSIDKKAPNITEIFIYKAMNISGIGLKDDDFGEIREGKYVQVIAITYEPDKNGKKRAKNISLGYFGKAESLDDRMKNEVIEFVLRWRYEKAFQNLEHYRMLLERVNKKRS
jgi:hypothetical protein